jgi:Arc/MetJ-type ribon-helix-helix transcriptional regulator
MLSIRLPEQLADQLESYCSSAGESKSTVVKLALANHLSSVAAKASAKKSNRFAAHRGTGLGRYTTDEVMCMTRGADWNQA